jgi:hypothetical protein
MDVHTSSFQAPDTRFSGRWVGETQGCDMPAHIWEIIPRGDFLFINTRWENETRTVVLHGELIPGEDAFRINSFKATLVDPQHFLIPGWDTNDKRGGVGPAFDVVFSRPGIAELTAQEVWLKHRLSAA